MTKWMYQRNDALLNDDTVNITFDECLAYNEEEFQAWIKRLRSLVVYEWDKKGIPPVVGKSLEDVEEMMREMEGFPVEQFLLTDETTGKQNIIRNTQTDFSSIINGYFPGMMKTKINYSAKGDGKSIYDWFADDSLFERHVKYCRRHFKKDGFYHYSLPILENTVIDFLGKPRKFATVEEYLEAMQGVENYSFWLAIKDEDAEYTGYNEALKGKRYLRIEEKSEVWKLVPPEVKRTIGTVSDSYQVRHFKRGQRLFPAGLKAFKVSYCQYAVNFPPLTAKFLYERYTQPGDVVVWDPSSGWGGRILGAMAVKDDRNVHYIGTDPNRDHDTEVGRTKYHEIADHYNTVRNSARLFDHVNTYEIHQVGSEEMGNRLDFAKWKGKIDLVFTSPPYFAKEVYSADPEQSCNKFPSYEGWKNGFLRPTLQTAVEWLKPKGYILWNIADAKFGPDLLPLEQDSCDILKSLGMKHVDTLFMTLAQMPGANRTNEDGTATAKNYCKVNGMILKYEPIFVFFKE